MFFFPTQLEEFFFLVCISAEPESSSGSGAEGASPARGWREVWEVQRLVTSSDLASGHSVTTGILPNAKFSEKRD